MKKMLSLAVVIGLVAPAVWAETYSIDPAHSSVGFRVKHVVGKVTGTFGQFAGTFSYDPAKPQALSAEATIQSASISTANAKRDSHLRSPDFLDVQKYPTLTFKSDRVTSVQGAKAQLAGELTIHGVTKPVVLDVDLGGVAKDPMGNQRAGASVTTHINRRDFNVGPSSGPVAGMVGNDVEITIDVEGVKK